MSKPVAQFDSHAGAMSGSVGIYCDDATVLVAVTDAVVAATSYATVSKLSTSVGTARITISGPPHYGGAALKETIKYATADARDIAKEELRKRGFTVKKL